MPETLLKQYARQFIHQMPMAVVIFDRELRVLDRNPAATQLLADGQTVVELLDGIEPGGEPGWPDRLGAILAGGAAQTLEPVTCRRPQRDLILKLTCIPMSGTEDGVVSGGALMVEDVTREALMTRDLASAERMAALGKLSAKVAHELNNPLDGIIRYLSLAIRLTEQQENLTIRKYLKESHRGLLRMVRILNDMLDFSREARHSIEQANVNQLIEDAVAAMALKADEFEVDIIRDLQEPMPMIRSGNLYQVFCNLIKNAIDAMPEGGRITIRSETDAETLTVACRDEGSGIEESDLERIFEPFYTTKPAGQGTGLGLPICRDIIERYGGRLTARNNPDRGCTFTITIPLDQTSWANGRPDSAPAPNARNEASS